MFFMNCLCYKTSERSHHVATKLCINCHITKTCRNKNFFVNFSYILCVVRTEFLEQYPVTVKEFLNDYKASIEYLLENTAEASLMIESNGIFQKAAIAEKAIPNCNVCYLDGAEMKNAMEIYLGALYQINPASIGGALPKADFYYNAE